VGVSVPLPNGGRECSNVFQRISGDNRLRFDVSAIKAQWQGAAALPLSLRSCGCEAGPIKGQWPGCFRQGHEQSEPRFRLSRARARVVSIFVLYCFKSVLGCPADPCWKRLGGISRSSGGKRGGSTNPLGSAYQPSPHSMWFSKRFLLTLTVDVHADLTHLSP
jgi:hypothetical protein